MSKPNTCLECGALSRTHFCLDCIEAEQLEEENLREAEDVAHLAGVPTSEVVAELFPELEEK